jgi:hypothetical protein
MMLRQAASIKTVQLTQTELLAARDRYLANAREKAREQAAFHAGERIAKGDLRPSNLTPIMKWKSPRPIGLIRGNLGKEVREALKFATTAHTARVAVSVLCGPRGVNIPVTSAILTAIFPDRFTVIDYRALESLGVKMNALTLNYYLVYLDYCRGTAAQYGLTLRDLDRALWQTSKDAT